MSLFVLYCSVFVFLPASLFSYIFLHTITYFLVSWSQSWPLCVVDLFGSGSALTYSWGIHRKRCIYVNQRHGLYIMLSASLFTLHSPTYESCVTANTNTTFPTASASHWKHLTLWPMLLPFLPFVCSSTKDWQKIKKSVREIHHQSADDMATLVVQTDQWEVC